MFVQFCCKKIFKTNKIVKLFFICKMSYQIMNDNLFFGLVSKLIIFFFTQYFYEEVAIFISNIQCTYLMVYGVFGQNGGVFTFVT